MGYNQRDYQWGDHSGAGAGVWSGVAEAGLGKGPHSCPCGLGIREGRNSRGPQVQFCGFHYFAVWGWGGGGYYYSLEKGRRKNVEELNEDS